MTGNKAKKSTKVYVSLGSNLGDRNANIKKALRLVKEINGVDLKKVSSIYETRPLGGPKQGNFLNGVFEITTNLGPIKLLRQLQKIENALGRTRGVKNGPRTMDLDMLLYGEEKINKKE
ncbi:MAG: 2-amino-4-hydroxy-6-hydroxymethyldihydropteridine diphosphokinase, partial [Candidatus Omnitrophota bacterium]